MYLKYIFSKKTNEFTEYVGKKKIVIALAADYGNLGDVAITFAQKKFFESNYPEYVVIDFPISKTFTSMKSLKKVINSNDIITIVGGGNTGDLYDDIEYCRQFVIKQFPRNKIISFPQTIDFSKGKKGKDALKKAIKVYSSHENYILAAREKASFEKYKKYFPNNKIVFTPDIVLSLNEEQPMYVRENVTLCLRNDDEKILEKDKEQTLIGQLQKKHKLLFNDTHINKNNLTIEERENELNKLWTSFKKSKVVVTDRLHGMIFCAITQTPCIAIDNSNKKISGVYNAWLKDYTHIKMITNFDIEEIETLVEEQFDFQLSSSTNIDLSKEFQDLTFL